MQLASAPTYDCTACSASWRGSPPCHSCPKGSPEYVAEELTIRAWMLYGMVAGEGGVDWASLARDADPLVLQALRYIHHEVASWLSERSRSSSGLRAARRRLGLFSG